MDEKRLEYLVTAEQMKEYDRNTSEHFGVPSLVLMERAALACAQVILEKCGRKRERVLIAAGCGNNGGDGLAVGRILMQEGFPVDFWLIGERSRCSPETKKQLSILENYGRTIRSRAPEERYGIIVDAIFGTGLRRAPEGAYAEAVECINRSGAFVLSVDIPSGVCADTGKVYAAAVRADVTVTFAFLKRGLLLYPGASFAGQVLTAQIGITKESFLGKVPEAFTFPKGMPVPLPERKADGNKGTFGKVLLAAGSPGMEGAAILSASAVLRAGAGMARVLCEKEERLILQSAAPEVMLAVYERKEEDLAGGGEDPASAAFRKAADWADVIAAGPGLGRSEQAGRLIRLILTETAQPLILDADGINLLAQERAFLEELCRKRRKNPRPLILTPHPGELSRLTGKSVEEILSDPVSVSREWAARLNAVLVCKTAATVTARPDGACYVNRSGNSGMATAGSGDVLTGILAGLLAQGMEAFEAACAGVYLHGLAGDAAAARSSEYNVSAGRILEALDLVMKPDAVFTELFVPERQKQSSDIVRPLTLRNGE
ncbi:MAG TPA: NAD(P)H-hydrate dehydratase [Candidatus Eisenbergiella intestinipullorum]|nr:NAD(P)H-hydrate dehydratase [Candidatus Eisenbergiella intestinipullorum]